MNKFSLLSGLLMCLVFTNQINAQDKIKFDFSLQGGFNIINSVTGGNNTKFSTKSALPTIYIESHLYPFKEKEIINNLGLGIGVGFYNMKVDDPNIGWLWTYGADEVASLYWWPLYISLKYNLPLNDKLSPYFKIDNGYSFFAISDNAYNPADRPSYRSSWGGYYLSMSAGITVLKFVNIELSYSLLNSGIDTDYRYSGYWYYWYENYKTKALTLSFGVCF